MVEATGTTRRGRGARAAARQKRDVKMLPALKRNLPLTEPIPSPLPIGNVSVPRWWMKRCFWIVTWCVN